MTVSVSHLLICTLENHFLHSNVIQCTVLIHIVFRQRSQNKIEIRPSITKVNENS